MSENIAVDTDFLNHMLEIQNSPNLYDLICRFFQALDVTPWVHPLVYKNEMELVLSTTGKNLFENKKIFVQTLETIWNNQPAKKKYYEMMVSQIYYDFMGEQYPCASICDGWRSQKSLGEVHTVVMCAFLGWNCFLSDDGRAACELGRIVLERLMMPIHIYNRKDRCDYIKGKPEEQRCGLTRNELKLLSHKS